MDESNIKSTVPTKQQESKKMSIRVKRFSIGKGISSMYQVNLLLATKSFQYKKINAKPDMNNIPNQLNNFNHCTVFISGKDPKIAYS